MATLDWRGDEVFAKVLAATVLGVDRTLAESASQAKTAHRWVSRTGFLEATIGVLAFAHVEGLRVSGSFGALANYALFVEVGTSRVGATALERVMASGGWWTIPGPAPAPGVTVSQSFTILPPGGEYGFSTVHRGSKRKGPLTPMRAYLRPSAYVQFPLLPLRIAAAYQGEAMI